MRGKRTMTKDTTRQYISQQSSDLTENLPFQETIRAFCINCNGWIPKERQNFYYDTCSKECTRIKNETKRRKRKVLYEFCQYCGDPISLKRQRLGAKFCPQPKDCYKQFKKENIIVQKQQRKLTIREAAFEFLYTNKPFQDCMQGWIDFAIEHGAVKINIAWVAWSVRQFGHLQFKNAYVPYFKKWICKNWPEYAKYFKGNK